MILLTGGTGFVGRHLLEALLTHGHAVRVLTRAGSALAGRAGLEVATGDLADPDSVERAAEGASTVIHLAARIGQPGDDPAALHDFNVTSAATLGAAARHAGAARFLHLSSAGVYGDGDGPDPHSEPDAPRPGNPYERSKLAAEEAIERELAGSVARLTILRPSGIYGPGRPATQEWLERIRGRRLWLHSHPRVIVHPTYVGDVVQACVRVIEGPDPEPRVINIGGARALPLQEWIALAARLLGMRARQVVMPGPLGRALARPARGALRGLRLPVPAVVERASRHWINRAVDITLARRVLRFEPVPLEEGLRETIARL